MPEGPETHFVADRLRAVLVGAPLEQVAFADPGLQRCAGTLCGHRIASVQARGKALLTCFDHGVTLYTHSQLLGRWDIHSPPRPVRGEPRAYLATPRGSAALYIAPKVELWRTSELDAHPFLARLGPDVLDPAVTPAVFVASLRSSRFARSTLATLLLKQEFAAGMGNYLRSEVLFRARLSPHRRVAQLEGDARRRLAHALIDVPRLAYRAKFRGRPPASDKDYLPQLADTFAFGVFEREGEACPDCGGRVGMERIAGRRVYWCPRCQR